ncbi:Vgb family protein [Baekduia alba]|uniref:Vgb family protein n=1 Tax=Baekduia alba TaxID=2997333 RepID=UPI0023408EE7|nr:hypothetical protein [Baekduia alba]
MVSATGAAALDSFPLPAGYTVSNFGVTTDGDGNVWFGVAGPQHTSPAGTQDTPTLGRMKPAEATAGTSGGLTFFPTPDRPNAGCCSDQLRSVTYNKDDGKLYFVHSTGGYGVANPSALSPGTSTGIVTYGLPGYTDLGDVAPAKGGGMWFTEKGDSNVAPTYYGNRIARWDGGLFEGPNIAIQNGNTSLNGLRYPAQPSGIAVDPTGRPWFAEENPGNPGYRIGTYAGAGDHYDEYQVSPCENPANNPCSGSYTGTGLSDVAVAADGAIWFTNVDNRKFGRFDPGTHTMTQYLLSSVDPSLAAGNPRQIVAAPDGTLWMTVYKLFSASNALVRIVPGTASAPPTATFTKTGSDSAPLAVGASAADIWFTTTDNKLNRLAGVVGGSVTPPPSDGGGSGSGSPGGTAGGGTATPAATTPASNAPPVVLRPATVGQAKLDPPQTGNGAINTNQICVGPPEARCALVYLVNEHEYVVGFPSSLAAKKKHKPRTLATKAVTLRGGQSAKVTIKLNKLGQRILKKNGKVKVDFIATEKLANGKTRVVSRKTLTVRAAKRHH